MKELPKVCFSLFLLLVACQQKPASQETEVPITEQSAPTQQKLLNPLLTEYERFLGNLDSSKVENMSVAASKYAALYKGQPTSVADSGYVLFDKFYQRSDNTLNEKHDIGKYDSLLISHSISLSLKQLRELKSYEKLLKANGFQLAMSEGITYLQQDRDFIARYFYPFISPVLKEYLTRLNKENKEGFAEDAGLTIPATLLADRVIWWEDFVQRNPEFILLESAEAERKSYLSTLLMGMDNSPILSFDDNKLDKYYADAYRHLNMKAPTSVANKMVWPYFLALQKTDTAQANALLKKYEKNKDIDYFVPVH